ncbi:small subunit processome component 20 homolog [Uloborus diversus]|uniref:small subunit processome component 20 homolog n=1 Tax=Uloborus diversus TaxID=327109 RepID=UPI0024092874|nr:small subunit processome component 20 homolog [Uloborus diversus]
MKDKPVSHKHQNTFHFLTFAERISKINIDVIHQIRKTSSCPEEQNTFFLEAIEKWVDLNYSQDYTELQKEIGSEIRNLSQIVFRQNELIEILLKYLRKEESLALDAILELVVALARDLQYEFYPHFPKFFSAITLHFSSKDTDLLEKLFTCLSYLFKFLWRYMVKDIENVYRLFSSLLSDTHREHIRVFSVESFAFLIRKVPDKEKLFSFIFQDLEENPKQALGVGQLMFEVVKGVKEQFHSCTESVLKLLFQFLGNEKYSLELIKQVLVQMVNLMARHTSPKYCSIIQKVFCEVIQNLLLSLSENESKPHVENHLTNLLHLFHVWITFKNGKLISSNKVIVQVLLDLSKLIYLPEHCLESIVDILSSVMLSDCAKLSVEHLKNLISQIYTFPVKMYFHFTRSMYMYGMFEKDVLPCVLTSCLELIKSGDLEKKHSALEILSESILAISPISTSKHDVKSFKKLLPSCNFSSKSAGNDMNVNVLENALFEILKVTEDNEIQNANLRNLWSALVCLPHVRHLNIEQASIILQELAVKVQTQLMGLQKDNLDCLEEFGFVLWQSYFVFLVLACDSDKSCFTTNFFLDLLRMHPTSVAILRIADLHFNQLKMPLCDKDFLCGLTHNLSSPYHLVRLLSLRILCSFNNRTQSSNKEVLSIFEICLEAEKLSFDVQIYREKLKWLRKLDYPYVEKSIPDDCDENLKKEYLKAAIQYLLGMLLVNFRLLWDPTLSVLESYAHGTTELFWEVFGEHLDKVVNICENRCSDTCNVIVHENEDGAEFNRNVVQFCKCEESPDYMNHRLLLWKAMEQFPDVAERKNKAIVPYLFRLIGSEIVKVDTSMAATESVNKKELSACDISTLEENSGNASKKFNLPLKRKSNCKESSKKSRKKHKQDEETYSEEKLDSEECSEVNDSQLNDSVDQRSNLNIGESSEVDESLLNESVDQQSEMVQESEEQNPRETKGVSDDSDVENENSDEDEEYGEVFSEYVVQKSSKQKRFAGKHYASKTLAAYLSVFTKFRNPKAIYKTEELQKLYKELLSYPDPVIQKLSFDCLMTYNYKYLTPYKENFYRILDNKTFKTEVVLFSLDTENNIILEEHRIDVLAVLMRILYGKMLHKTGNNTTGKSQANTRRSLVLRFLAGCKAEELIMFFDLVFLPFKELLKESTLVSVKNIRQSCDLSFVVPLRRQHSVLNSLGLILKHLGNLVPELLPYLLKVLLVITATSTALLERREEVLPHCINILKAVRTLAVIKLIQFFKSFPKYDFLPEEIDAVFESLVWPMAKRLEFDSVNQPSPLLRLFAAWSENPRYFCLFGKHHESSKLFSPLPHMIDLYASAKTKPKVIGVISKIIFEMLHEERNVPEDACENLPTLHVNNVDIPASASEGDENLGTKLLLPFIDKILLRLELTITNAVRRKSKKSLSSRNLKILLKLSYYVKDGQQSSKLINLLLPFLFKTKMEPESEVLILTTISNLIRKVENHYYFIKLFAPLFGKLSNQNSRMCLVEIFSTVAEYHEEIKHICTIISMINAFDLSQIGEPDYQKRLDGHKEALRIVQTCKEAPVNEDFLRIIVLNSSFMIRSCNDLGLRSSCSHLIQECIKVFVDLREQSDDLFRLLIFDTVLNEVQKGLKNSSEAVQHEFIGILSTLLHNCKNHPRLKELELLCHENQDLDFWENIKHTQVHRRARALLQFSNSLKETKEGEKVNCHYILSYMLPIVSSFLFNEAYNRIVHVIDAAIETLGSIAHVLPWQHYELLLKQYLDLLFKDSQHHKTIIKIVVALLDAFHFNLEITENNIDNINESCSIDLKETDPVQKENTADSQELSPAAVKKITITIKKSILPLLHRSLMRKTKQDDEHKLAGHYYPEDEEILRVPIALAMVKLLQKLPENSLEKNLPGLLLKMCGLLKSRTESIRETTRETLVKMMQSLGPKYFHCLLTEMKGVMTKGYQVHVMTFTVNAVLLSIDGQMKSGDLDSCVHDLTQICKTELFTDMAEEKEVTKITGKVKEARSIKSYSILQILSKYVSENLLLDLIMPLKEILFQKNSHKSLKKVSECLRHIAVGLSENSGVSTKGYLIFTYSIANENIPGLNPKKTVTKSDSAKFQREDIYLVPKEPGRSGPPSKINKRTNVHIFVEFGLQLFSYCLKKDKFDKNQQEILEMLDPFVPLLAECLSSNHVKITTSSLRCLLPLYKYPLPSLKTLTKKIVNSLFILINKYAAVGMAQGDNFEMIVMCFKMLTMLVRDTSYHELSEEQLQSLLSYIEQDIYDYTRQATAFSLLKAILSKKLKAPELRGILSKVAEMAITAEQEYIKSQCRQVCLQYILEYTHKETHLIKSISFFIAQLEYTHEPGRISAFEIVNSMLTSFNDDVVRKQAALFLVPLAARLVNDESPKCRKMAAQCLKKLLAKAGHDVRNALFSIPAAWLQAKKMSHKRLGFQICGLFAEVEQQEFETHLSEILPVYIRLIDSEQAEETKSSTDERCADHFLYHHLNSLTKILSHCHVMKNVGFRVQLTILFEKLQGLILHPHMWVRLTVSQLFGLLFSCYEVEEIQIAICKQDKSVIFLNNKQKLRDLSADFSTQLQSPYLNETLGQQVIRNLVYLARVISTLPESTCKNTDSNDVEVTLVWMVRKLCREAKKEVAETPVNSEKRKCVFMFIAAIAQKLGKERLMPVLSIALLPLCREISDASKHADEELKKNVKEVLDLIQSVVGVEDFTNAYTSVQSALLKKKVKRKQDKAKEAVTDPAKFAQKKIKKHLSKRESKKRKIMLQKGKKKVKKAKFTDFVISA